MTAPLRLPQHWAVRGWLPVAAALIGGCVAQEPYHERSVGGGGSAGKAASVETAGRGGLELAMSGSAGAGSAGAGSAGESSAGDGACLTSAQCAKPNPYCLVASQRCVECLSQRNCSGTGLTYCDTRTYSCVACLNDGQCTHARPYCSSSLGQCVECLSAENCGDPGLVCDRRNFLCVPSCSTHEDCAASPATPLCDPEASVCVACLGDDDCAAATPHCSPTARTCAQCLDDTDCQPGAQCAAGVCVNPK